MIRASKVGETGPPKHFQFSELRKSKREGLLELFWGEQPPFTLLRSVEGGTFFLGRAAVLSRAGTTLEEESEPNCETGAQPVIGHDLQSGVVD
jgi:hypothetical protein